MSDVAAQVEENENVINYALRKRNVKVLPRSCCARLRPDLSRLLLGM